MYKGKSVIAIIVAFILVFNVSSIAFGAEYANSKGNNSVKFTDSNVKKYEKRNFDYSIYEQKKQQSSIDQVTPQITDPGVGATQVVSTSMWSSGTIYDDQATSSNYLSNIVNVALSIVSFYTTTAQDVFIAIAYNCFGLSWSQVIQTKPGTAKIMHSYSYYDKLGQVWTSNRTWVTKVDIETRLWYKHEYASFSSSDGYARTSSYDFIPPNGYSAIHQDIKTHFNDNAWIQSEAYYRWSIGKANYVDAWTH